MWLQGNSGVRQERAPETEEGSNVAITKLVSGGAGTSGGATGGIVKGSLPGWSSGSLRGHTPGSGSFDGIVSGFLPGAGISSGFLGLAFVIEFMSMHLVFLSHFGNHLHYRSHCHGGFDRICDQAVCFGFVQYAKRFFTIFFFGDH